MALLFLFEHKIKEEAFCFIIIIIWNEPQVLWPKETQEILTRYSAPLLRSQPSEHACLMPLFEVFVVEDLKELWEKGVPVSHPAVFRG